MKTTTLVTLIAIALFTCGTILITGQYAEIQSTYIAGNSSLIDWTNWYTGWIMITISIFTGIPILAKAKINW